jgi:endoglucanase
MDRLMAGVGDIMRFETRAKAFAAILATFVVACQAQPAQSQASALPQQPPMSAARCINISNALEAPREGDWGHPIRLSDMAMIKAGGFDSVRAPIRWDHHAGPAPDYRIAPAHMERVAEVVDAALDAGLHFILDVHHYDALYERPAAERAKFIAIWRQIAARFANYPPGLIFEPINEPRGPQMTPDMVYQLNADALAAIRPLHPARLVILGGPNWNSIEGLRQLRLPRDRNLAVTFHYYEPFEFTHHMAVWMDPKPRFERRWGTPADREKIRADFAAAGAIARRLGVPLFLGEFGVNKQIPLDQRALWVREVRRNAEAIGASWCHFDFVSEFPMLNDARTTWLGPMVSALLDQPVRQPTRPQPPPQPPPWGSVR